MTRPCEMGRPQGAESSSATPARAATFVDALLAIPQPRVAGIVVAGTGNGNGNGTVHHALEAALHRAMVAGVAVRRCTRCAVGGVIGGPASLPSAGDLTPAQARIELMLELLAWPEG